MLMNRLRNAMNENNVTVEDLARTLHQEVSNTRELIHYVDARYGDFKALRAICETCNCSADYLLGLSDVMNPVGN